MSAETSSDPNQPRIDQPRPFALGPLGGAGAVVPPRRAGRGGFGEAHGAGAGSGGGKAHVWVAVLEEVGERGDGHRAGPWGGR